MSDIGDRHDPRELDSAKPSSAISLLKGILYRLGNGISVGNEGPALEVVSPPITAAAVFSGQVTVTTANTAVPGPDISNARGFYICGRGTNTGVIYVGNDGAGDVASTNGYTLTAGQQIFWPGTNLNLLYFDASVSGEKACWLKV